MKFFKNYRQISFGFVIVGVIFLSRFQLEKYYSPPYVSFDQLVVLNSDTISKDVSLILMGGRAIAADLAYIDLLQYLGGASYEEQAVNPAAYPLLKNLTLRVMRIDPHFVRAVIFGGVALAWLKNINRISEATDIFKEGMKNNPTYWAFQAYILAIVYKNSDFPEKMLATLESTLDNPDCPDQVKAILANVYKKNGDYRKARAIWFNLYTETKDSGFQRRAEQELRKIDVELAH